jgi:hypothetical protein
MIFEMDLDHLDLREPVLCSDCGLIMRLVGIEPHSTTHFVSLLTYECVPCRQVSAVGEGQLH